jgi:hypothetical protein
MMTYALLIACINEILLWTFVSKGLLVKPLRLSVTSYCLFIQ